MSHDGDILSSIAFFFNMVGDVSLELANNITESNIAFPLYVDTSIFETSEEIGRRLRQYYLYGALTQLYKIIGSIELGDAASLVTNLSGIGNGVDDVNFTDFLSEPSHGMITSPVEIVRVGKQVAKGTLNLVSRTTDGVIGGTTNITRSFGRGLAKISMDPSYNSVREELNKPPRTSGDAMIRPLRDVGNGIYFAVVGLAKVPYNNYRRYGKAGIISGLVKGVAGAATKPVVGVLDALTHTGDAVRAGVRTLASTNSALAYRMHFSAVFGPDGRVLPDLRNVAFAEHVLSLLRFHGKSEGLGLGHMIRSTSSWGLKRRNSRDKIATERDFASLSGPGSRENSQNTPRDGGSRSSIHQNLEQADAWNSLRAGASQSSQTDQHQAHHSKGQIFHKAPSGERHSHGDANGRYGVSERVVYCSVFHKLKSQSSRRKAKPQLVSILVIVTSTSLEIVEYHVRKTGVPVVHQKHKLLLADLGSVCLKRYRRKYEGATNSAGKSSADVGHDSIGEKENTFRELFKEVTVTRSSRSRSSKRSPNTTSTTRQLRKYSS